MDFLNPAQRLQFLQYLVDLQRDIAEIDGDIEQVVQARRRRRVVNRRRAVSVRPWLLRRSIYGHYETLLAELNREDCLAFRNYTRMDPEMFFELVEPQIRLIVLNLQGWYSYPSSVPSCLF